MKSASDFHKPERIGPAPLTARIICKANKVAEQLARIGAKDDGQNVLSVAIKTANALETQRLQRDLIEGVSTEGDNSRAKLTLNTLIAANAIVSSMKNRRYLGKDANVLKVAMSAINAVNGFTSL